jgi:dienelactone hydrolase
MRSRVFALLLVFAISRLDAQGARVRGTGRLDTLVTAAEDTTQHYALYLPSTYDAKRRWPILFVLDPRGRAREALELFREGAERTGTIVMSSYDSRSDVSDAQVNTRAINAMFGSAQDRLSIDPHRLYLAGLSGTARAAIAFALELRGTVAGVIGAGAGSGAEADALATAARGDSTFAYFAVTGTDDFNNEEVRALAERLDAAHVPNRLAIFDGPHQWPPASVCGDALDWMTLRAMRGGLAPIDTAWMAKRLDAELASASDLEARGRLEEASRLFSTIARDYAPSARAEDASRRAATIESREPVRRLRARMRELAARSAQRGIDAQAALLWFRTGRDAPLAAALAERLQLPTLRQEMSIGDSLEAPAARRALSRISALVSFYEPRAYLGRGDLTRATRMLEVATSIAPLRGEACDQVAELRRRAPAMKSAVLDAQCR